MRGLIASLWFAVSALLAGPAIAEDTPAQRLVAAVSALNEIQADLDAAAPFSHLQRARAVAVLPDVVKVGLVLGGQVGAGVISVRGPDDRWSPPAFINLLSGSVGWQAGVESSDVILVFRTEEGMRKLIDGKLNLGGDVGITVGRSGKQIDTSTEIRYRAEVESYSRVRGLYAGLSFEGADLSPDVEANASLYGAEFADVIAGRVLSVPGAARDFMNVLERLAPASGAL
ncbi:MAG: lipid-binding SYLF domain-containing protein [Gammaproteobacteria bacterium]|nr:lipid-binding SYLF domain-containing protein [Gammaproteobacteria bacterium]